MTIHHLACTSSCVYFNIALVMEFYFRQHPTSVIIQSNRLPLNNYLLPLFTDIISELLHFVCSLDSQFVTSGHGQ